MRQSVTAFACLACLLVASTGLGQEEKTKPAIRIRLTDPDVQLQEILKLFEGSKAASPAAALSAWKRASKEPKRLGKPLEALIAAFNPQMVGELKTLKDAEFSLWFDPETGRPDWMATLPHDDGTFSALATAFVLTDGAVEEPLEGLAVDRLGPPGSVLMARAPGALLLAGSNRGLSLALGRSRRPIAVESGKGIQFRLEPEAISGSKSLALKRLGPILPGSVSGMVGMDGSSLVATLDLGRSKPKTVGVVDPEWLSSVPIDRAMFAFALAIDPSPENWNSWFQLADRVERADPARTEIAPLRLRLDLLGRTVGLRIDADLLPHLRGISGWIGSTGSNVEDAFLQLHLDDPAAVGRILDRARQLPDRGQAPKTNVGSGRWLGQVDGRPVRIDRLGSSVVISWGDRTMELADAARKHPDQPVLPLIPGIENSPGPMSVGLVWPGRVPGLFTFNDPKTRREFKLERLGGGPELLPEMLPLDRAMLQASRVSWTVRPSGDDLHLAIGWKGLNQIVQRFLELIPPDH